MIGSTRPDHAKEYVKHMTYILLPDFTIKFFESFHLDLIFSFLFSNHFICIFLILLMETNAKRHQKKRKKAASVPSFSSSSGAGGNKDPREEEQGDKNGDDVDLNLTLAPPKVDDRPAPPLVGSLQAGPVPTKEEVENELFTFLSSFGSRDVRKNVLEKTISRLDLNVASPEKRAKISQLMQELSKTKFSAYEAKEALIKQIKAWEKGGGN